MKKLKTILIASIPLLLLTAFVVYRSYHECWKTAFPLKSDETASICFAYSPKYDGNYTLTDDNRIQEIINEINQLERSDEGRLPSRSEGFYSLHFYQVDGTMFTLELDNENILTTKVRHELYAADCSTLCSLLEQTYLDLRSGICE